MWPIDVRLIGVLGRAVCGTECCDARSYSGSGLGGYPHVVGSRCWGYVGSDVAFWVDEAKYTPIDLE